MNSLAALMDKLIAENSFSAMDQTEYRDKYGEYEKRFTAAQKWFDELQKQKEVRFAEAQEIKRFSEILQTGQTTDFVFDEDIWNAVVDHVTVFADGTLKFTFKNGKNYKKTNK